MNTGKTRLSTVWIRPVVALVALTALSGVARATMAEDAVRNAVESKISSMSNYRARDVRFLRSQEQVTSNTERRVSGRGTFSDDSRQVDFTFSGRYDTRSRRTWDVSVLYDRYDRGRDPGYDRDPIRGRDRNGARLSIWEPRQGAYFDDTRVKFSGASDGRDVRISVFERGSLRSATHFAVRNGRWEGSIKLREGNYRAEVSTVGSSQTVTVNFTVRERGRDRGDDRSYGDLRIYSPRERSTVDGRDLRISGSWDGVSVRVRIYDRDDRRVYDELVRVRDGRWSVSPSLRYGDYRAEVEASGRRSTVRFRVR